jgi:hypothetical protein
MTDSNMLTWEETGYCPVCLEEAVDLSFTDGHNLYKCKKCGTQLVVYKDTHIKYWVVTEEKDREVGRTK